MKSPADGSGACGVGSGEWRGEIPETPRRQPVGSGAAADGGRRRLGTEPGSRQDGGEDAIIRAEPDIPVRTRDNSVGRNQLLFNEAPNNYSGTQQLFHFNTRTLSHTRTNC